MPFERSRGRVTTGRYLLYARSDVWDQVQEEELDEMADQFGPTRSLPKLHRA
jgi:hypothetical protein